MRSRSWLWLTLLLGLAAPALAAPVARGQNLLPDPGFETPGGWTAYGAGFAVDTAVRRTGKAALRLEGTDSDTNVGTMRRLVFDPPLAGPLRLSGWSKAESAAAAGAGWDYGPYLDITYADGTHLWGQRLSFTPALHDWEFREVVIEPEKPVTAILFHVLFRRLQGKVWFDDLALELLPFRLGVPEVFGCTDQRGPRVALRVGANMPARWTLQARQGDKALPALTGAGQTFTAAVEGLRPGQVELALSAADEYRGEAREWRTNYEVPAHPIPPTVMYAPASAALPLVQGIQMTGLAGLRGEAESLQVLVNSPFDLDAVEVTVTDLKGPGGAVIPKTSVDLRRVAKVQGVDDALLPYRPLDLKAWQTSVLWLTVRIPRDARPGQYEGRVLVAAADRPASGPPLRVRVWNAELPVRPSLPAVVGIGDGMLSQQYGLQEGTPEWSARLAAWWQLLKSYRLSPYFCRFSQREPNHYAYPAPWPLADPRSEPYLKAPDVAAYAIEYPLGGDEEKLARNLDYLQRKGWLDRGFLYLWDEPNRVEHYDKLRQWADKVHRLAPAAKVLTTYYCGPLDGPQKDQLDLMPEILRDSTQILCMSEWAAAGRDDYRARLKLAPGQQWWAYVCCGPGYPQPNLYLGGPGNANRAVMWRLYAQAAEGFLYWCANAQRWDVKPDQPVQFREGPPGDGVLAYPGEAYGATEPVPTIRLERLRDGLEDVEYLRACERKLGRAETLARFKAVYARADWYTHEHWAVEQWRQDVARTLGWE